MCKIVTFTNMSKVKNLTKLIDITANELLAYERHGFGYAIQSESGVFGERVCKTTSFKSSFNSEILDFDWLEKTRNKFGVKGKKLGAGIFHGRTSTNHVNILNTHPIVKNNLFLIHNGVVNNQGPAYKMETTNDTEHIVHHLSTSGIEAIERYISGYYAVSAIDQITGDLIIFKDSIANLHCAYVKEMDSLMFATTPELIESICSQMKYSHSLISVVSNNVYLKFNSNTLIEQKTIKPLGYSKRESSLASLSLGRNIDTKVSQNEANWSSQKVNESWGGFESTVVDGDNATSEEMFLYEVKNEADHTYTFMDYKGYPMSYKEFLILEDDEMLSCTVVRPDGTIVSPDDYYTEKLYA